MKGGIFLENTDNIEEVIDKFSAMVFRLAFARVNNSHDANSLAIGEYAFRDSTYGNVGSGNAHKNALANNSTI